MNGQMNQLVNKFVNMLNPLVNKQKQHQLKPPKLDMRTNLKSNRNQNCNLILMMPR